MRHFTRICITCAMIIAGMVMVYAYDPPAGGDGLPFLLSPAISGGTMSVASLAGPMADSLNPAASAAVQRVTLDLGYGAIVGLGTEQGFGSAINLGIAIPAAYGVWTGALNFISIPQGLVSMPLGTLFNARVGMAKDIYPNFYLGIGLDTTLGSNVGTDWGLGADLGIVHLLGTREFLKNLRYGVALRNMGKAFSPAGVAGFAGTSPASSYDSPFTLALGTAADVFTSEKSGLRLGANIDIYLPSFQNLVFAAGLELAWKEMAFARLGWDINAREALAGSGKSLLPSFGISATIPINRKSDESIISKKGWDKSEIRPSLSARPLYNGAWAIGGGVSLPLGVIDIVPPQITLTYPATSYGSFYMSPNSDGKLDEIALPVTITDQHYVESFSFKIFDKDGTLIRTIANKESRPETQNLSSLLNRIFYVKKGVPIPAQLVWNGLAESGSVVPDGIYSFVVDATDDNGNTATSRKYELVVDNTPPALALAVPAAADTLIFSPDGDGNKDAFTVKQTGSREDLWKGEIVDAAGISVRVFTFKDIELADLQWDGKNDGGKIVSDGVYAYRVASTDRAANPSSAKLDNILVNTQQPPINVSIDQGAFSPNGDGVKDVLTLSPSVPVKTGLAIWKLSVVDASNKERWANSGSAASGVPEQIPFEGRDSAGAILPEGQYRTKLTVQYSNGHSPESWSPAFFIDVSAPLASAKLDRAAFNPLAGGNSVVTITQSGSSEERWVGQILDVKGKSVKSWSFIGTPDTSLSWDGADETGRVVADGIYTYHLAATDKAGNSVNVSSAAVSIDTEKKAVRLAVDMRAFSPNGDAVKEVVTLLPETASADRVKSWTLTVLDSAKTTVRAFKGNAAPPARQAWDGKTDSGTRAPDGIYTAKLEVRYITDELESAVSFDMALDTAVPAITVTAADTLFSPNGDGRKDTIKISQESKPGDNWEGRISSADGKVVRSFAWKDKALAFEWDGTDSEGNKLPDGNYSYSVRSEDLAGNKVEVSLKAITVDAKPVQAFVTASAAGFSPNGDGKFDELSFGLIVPQKEGIDSWKLAVVDAQGITRKTFGGKGFATIPQKQPWDGKGDVGSTGQGSYTASFTVDYLKGDRAEAKSAAFVLDTAGPRLSATVGPKLFSPDNDGIDDELNIKLAVVDESQVETWAFEVVEVAVTETQGSAIGKKTRAFFTWTGKGKPAERLVWDGRSQKGELVEAASDYPYRLTVEDALGNQSVAEGFITVDVLVIRDGDKLKIKVPSIVFRSGFADFKELPGDVVARNEEVLKRIAQILNRFRDYNIRVEGHANSIAKMRKASQAEIDREEKTELLGLSKNRASLVMQKLIEFGVDGRRLSVDGLGSSQPVVPFTDADNLWKNRRVEFILIK